MNWFSFSKKGLGPLHSYSVRMGLEPKTSYSRNGPGFLGNRFLGIFYVCYLPRPGTTGNPVFFFLRNLWVRKRTTCYFAVRWSASERIFFPGFWDGSVVTRFGSMGRWYICIYIYFRYFFNGECIGKYTIHGSYGLGSLPICWRHKK